MDVKIAELHPIKRKKFLKVYRSFQQYHYSRGFLKRKVYEKLKTPVTSKELAEQFDRTPSRISGILIALRKEGKISFYKVLSNTYWLRNDVYLVPISTIKQKYLRKLGRKPYTTAELSKEFLVDPKSSLRRLRELEQLGLVRRETNKKWILSPRQPKVIVL